MKKIYEQPATLVVAIETQQIIAASDGKFTFSAGNGTTQTQGSDAISPGMSRRVDVWGDEE